jgi:leucine dehydrogenase
MTTALKEKKKSKYGIKFEHLPITGYEQVVKITSEEADLTAVVAMHNTTLGPALGGTRIYNYPTFEAALNDALRLSAGMTYKSAASLVGWGGGKSVIFLRPNQKKTEKMLLAFGEAVHSLGGKYICAEDVGCAVEDVKVINRENPYVVGLPHAKSSGNPSPYTAWGTFLSIQATCKKLFGSDSIEGKRVALQGLGSVGMELAQMLFKHGAKLLVADVDVAKTQMAAKMFGALVAPVQEIHSVECEIFSPCALGGIINDQTLPRLRCRGIAGAANNQLLRENHAELLHQRGILYAPDFVVNSGGLINVSCELDEEGYDRIKVMSSIRKSTYEQLTFIFRNAELNGISTQRAALKLCEHNLRFGIGKRKGRIFFHHSNVTIEVK